MQATTHLHSHEMIDLRRIIRRRYAAARVLWWVSEGATALAVLALLMAGFV